MSRLYRIFMKQKQAFINVFKVIFKQLNALTKSINYKKLLCIHTWSELLVPLVNMIKEGCENKCALLILLLFFLNHRNQSFHWRIRI